MSGMDLNESSFEFNKIIPLDKWKLNVLNRAKETITPVKQVDNGGFL